MIVLFGWLCLAFVLGIIWWELAGWLFERNRCIAIRERRAGERYWGRCGLARRHDGLHRLDRGMDEVWWSTAEVPAGAVPSLLDHFVDHADRDVDPDLPGLPYPGRHRHHPQPTEET